MYEGTVSVSRLRTVVVGDEGIYSNHKSSDHCTSETAHLFDRVALHKPQTNRNRDHLKSSSTAPLPTDVLESPNPVESAGIS